MISTIVERNILSKNLHLLSSEELLESIGGWYDMHSLDVVSVTKDWAIKTGGEKW